MPKTFLTADTHFGHDAVIGFCNRPHKNVEHMNSDLIARWNARVRPADTVIFVGDFAFRQKGSIRQHMEKLSGNKVMIRGNHDRNNGLMAKIQNLTLRNGDIRMFCVHDPRHVNRDVYVNLVGHVHQAWMVLEVRWTDTNRNNLFVNVGVDKHRYYPVELQEVLRIIVEHNRLGIPPVMMNYAEWIKPRRKRIEVEINV
jgi:calcineurin-like phosphoesterase family protein